MRSGGWTSGSAISNAPRGVRGEESGLRGGTDAIEQQVAGLGHHGPGDDETFVPERVEGAYGGLVVGVPAVGKGEPEARVSDDHA